MSAVAPAVVLHIYDLGKGKGIRKANAMLRPLGAGLFHAGVEVLGKEWSFGGLTTKKALPVTGVFQNAPKACDAHSYRQSIAMGNSKMEVAEVRSLLRRLAEEWLARDYDLTRRNCCSFCDTLCKELGVGGLPAWVLRLPRLGASARQVTKQLKGSGLPEDHCLWSEASSSNVDLNVPEAGRDRISSEETPRIEPSVEKFGARLRNQTI